MTYTIKNVALLKKILWTDALLGGTTAFTGLCFFNRLTSMLGLSQAFILSVSIITLGYAVIACILANQTNISVSLVRKLILANWIWTVISIVLLTIHFGTAQLFGKIFLLLQIIAVGGLAYLEGRQIVTTPAQKA